MAGPVRQPIDIASLERYISANVPEIKVPVDVKQVQSPPHPPELNYIAVREAHVFVRSSDTGSQTPRTSSPPRMEPNMS